MTSAAHRSRSPSLRLGLTMLASTLLSALGVVYAVQFGVAADGGRGGAMGCALTFLMFFITRPTAEAALGTPLPTDANGGADVLAGPNPTNLVEALTQIGALKVQVARLRAAIAVMLDAASREKIYLSVASVVSTLAWGFGDVLAKNLGAPS